MNKLSVWNWVCIQFAFCAAMAIATPAQTFDRLHSFDGADGKYPSSLVQGTNGNLYGTTAIGGANINSSCPFSSGCGTVFSMTTGGALTTLYNFCAQSNCSDGSEPAGALVQGTDGNFYGTTDFGGANDACSYGCGTVFIITPGGILTTLYSFCTEPDCADGYGPVGALMQGADGDFYGATIAGGNNSCGGSSFVGCGTVFKITPGGTLTTLYTFCSQTNCTDGARPEAGLVQGVDGNFYGTTTNGGATTRKNHSCVANDCGTVFKITPSGSLTTLYSFCHRISNRICADGAAPAAGLNQGTDGNFYGTTYAGGDSSVMESSGGGTVFSITAGGTLTTVYRFCAQMYCPDGARPQAALVEGTDGNFYGTTLLGGAYCFNQRCGTVFSVTPSGALTTLHNFDRPNSAYPAAALVQDTDGTFYGTTQQYGAYGNYGTVFSLSVGLGQFVETNPGSGAVGAAVTIFGTNLTGASSVTFNGTVATFTVVSASEITTTVPAGATTGTVQVVTPGGTLSSNVPFGVTH